MLPFLLPERERHLDPSTDGAKNLFGCVRAASRCIEKNSRLLCRHLQQENCGKGIGYIKPVLRVGKTSHRERLSNHERFAEPAQIRIRIGQRMQHGEDAVRMEQSEVNDPGGYSKGKRIKLVLFG